MSKNTQKIIDGIRELTQSPYELLSGVIEPGSVNETEGTVIVRLVGNGLLLEGVLLGTITGASEGLLLMPKEGSEVVIGCIEGHGAYTVLKMTELRKVTLKIGGATIIADESEIHLKQGTTEIKLGGGLVKLSTASESLFQLLNELLAAIAVVTVGTSTGPSTVPVNAATFSTLQTRLGNLLSA